MSPAHLPIPAHPEYFVAQRITLPVDGADEAAEWEYLHKLGLVHAIQVHAMKAK